MNKKTIETKKLVYLAVLTAIICILQWVTSPTKGFLPVSITLSLMPIAIGAALVGNWSGAWLGAVFGIMVLVTGDAAAFLTVNPLGTVVTVLLKGALAGLCSGLVYSLIEKKNRYVAIFAAAITAPIVNSAVFVLGCYLFFYDYVASLAGGANIFPFIVTVFVGINILIEVLVNIVLVPTVYRIVNIKKA